MSFENICKKCPYSKPPYYCKLIVIEKNGKKELRQESRIPHTLPDYCPIVKRPTS